MNLICLFEEEIEIENNLIFLKSQVNTVQKNQIQTKDTFSEKWENFEKGNKKEEVYFFQREWFLDLYGFSTEQALKEFLSDKKTIVDCGCGLGYKAAWFAELAPHATVIGIDISESVFIAAANYKNLKESIFFTRRYSGNRDFTQ